MPDSRCVRCSSSAVLQLVKTHPHLGKTPTSPGAPGFAPSVGANLGISALSSGLCRKMAEREGFEPPLPFRVNTLSKRAPSATRPSLRRHRLLREASQEAIASNRTTTTIALAYFPSDFMAWGLEPQPGWN